MLDQAAVAGNRNLASCPGVFVRRLQRVLQRNANALRGMSSFDDPPLPARRRGCYRPCVPEKSLKRKLSDKAVTPGPHAHFPAKWNPVRREKMRHSDRARILTAKPYPVLRNTRWEGTHEALR
jgi:hypothetical protein